MRIRTHKSCRTHMRLGRVWYRSNRGTGAGLRALMPWSLVWTPCPAGKGYQRVPFLR